MFDNNHYGIAQGGSTVWIGSGFNNRLTNRVNETSAQVATAYNFQGVFAFTNAAAAGVAAVQQVEVAGIRTDDEHMAVTNFFFGTFQVGDPVTGNKASVQLVDSRVNAPADAVLPTSEILAISYIQ